MAIVLTKYEDTANTNIVFDSSKFDYNLGGETFPADSLADIDSIIIEMGDVFYLEQQTTTEDTMGEITDISNTKVRIYASLQDITKKDLNIHEMGLAVSGNRKIFMKPSYDLISAGVTTTYIPKEDDIIVDRATNRWRIVTILGERHIEHTEIFKVAIVKSIGLEGSN